MSTSHLYHGFGIRGYEYVRTEHQDGQVIFAPDYEQSDVSVVLGDAAFEPIDAVVTAGPALVGNQLMNAGDPYVLVM